MPACLNSRYIIKPLDDSDLSQSSFSPPADDTSTEKSGVTQQSASSLSDKSLEICTESLGSDGFSSYDPMAEDDEFGSDPPKYSTVKIKNGGYSERPALPPPRERTACDGSRSKAAFGSDGLSASSSRYKT